MGINKNDLDPQQVANKIRARVLKQSMERGGGNLSQTCSSAEIMETLYTRNMKIFTFHHHSILLCFTQRWLRQAE